MEKTGTIEIGTQFQDAFARVYEDQIQQIIQDSRQEALATAKQILRENALNNVLVEKVTQGIENQRLLKMIELSEKKIGMLGNKLIEVARTRASCESGEDEDY